MVNTILAEIGPEMDLPSWLPMVNFILGAIAYLAATGVVIGAPTGIVFFFIGLSKDRKELEEKQASQQPNSN